MPSVTYRLNIVLYPLYSSLNRFYDVIKAYLRNASTTNVSTVIITLNTGTFSLTFRMAGAPPFVLFVRDYLSAIICLQTIAASFPYPCFSIALMYEASFFQPSMLSDFLSVILPMSNTLNPVMSRSFSYTYGYPFFRLFE